MVSFQDATLGADTNIVFSETPNISARISEEFTARNLHLTKESAPGKGDSYIQQVGDIEYSSPNPGCRCSLAMAGGR